MANIINKTQDMIMGIPRKTIDLANNILDIRRRFVLPINGSLEFERFGSALVNSNFFQDRVPDLFTIATPSSPVVNYLIPPLSSALGAGIAYKLKEIEEAACNKNEDISLSSALQRADTARVSQTAYGQAITLPRTQMFNRRSASSGSIGDKMINNFSRHVAYCYRPYYFGKKKNDKAAQTPQTPFPALENARWEDAVYMHPLDASVIGYKDLNSNQVFWIDPQGVKAPRAASVNEKYLRVDPTDPESFKKAQILNEARKLEEHARTLDTQNVSNNIKAISSGISAAVMGGVYGSMMPKMIEGFKAAKKAAAIKNNALAGSQVSSVAAGAADAAKSVTESATTETLKAAKDTVTDSIASGAAASGASSVISTLGHSIADSSVAHALGSAFTAAVPYLPFVRMAIPAAALLTGVGVSLWKKHKNNQAKKKILKQADDLRKKIGIKVKKGDYSTVSNPGWYTSDPGQLFVYNPKNRITALRQAWQG